jgi:hypothetical protein
MTAVGYNTIYYDIPSFVIQELILSMFLTLKRTVLAFVVMLLLIRLPFAIYKIYRLCYKNIVDSTTSKSHHGKQEMVYEPSLLTHLPYEMKQLILQ